MDEELMSASALNGGQFDIATLIITITDINDHAPEFRPGSCYPLSVPENSDLAVIHTVVATDLDEGANGEIVYSIIGKCCVVLCCLVCCCLPYLPWHLSQLIVKFLLCIWFKSIGYFFFPFSSSFSSFQVAIWVTNSASICILVNLPHVHWIVNSTHVIYYRSKHKIVVRPATIRATVISRW